MEITKNFIVYALYEISAQNLAYIHDASNIFKFIHSDMIVTIFEFYFCFSVSVCDRDSSVSVFLSVSVSDYVGLKSGH